MERESSGSRTVIDTRRRHRSLDVDCSIHATPPAAPIHTLPRTARNKNNSINSDLTQRPLFLAASRTESGPINNPFSSFRLDRCEWHKMRTIVTDVPSSLCVCWTHRINVSATKPDEPIDIPFRCLVCVPNRHWGEGGGGLGPAGEEALLRPSFGIPRLAGGRYS